MRLVAALLILMGSVDAQIITHPSSGGGAPSGACADAGGSHLNWTGTTFVCGNTTGGYLRATLSWGGGNIADGGYASITFPVPGAQLGQGIICGLPVLPAGLVASMSVIASGIVMVTVINVSGQQQNIAAGGPYLWTAEMAN